VVFKGKKIDESFVIRIISASKNEIKKIGKAKAILKLSENQKLRKKDKLENDETTFDFYQKVANFHDLTINFSTRMSIVFLSFETQITTNSNLTFKLSSNFSSPFVIITNESQWFFYF
jgi:hypothetical protein